MSHACDERPPSVWATTVQSTCRSRPQRTRLSASWNGTDARNETSERQWDDVSRLIRLLGDEADVVYLRQAADSVGVIDLLERLLLGR